MNTSGECGLLGLAFDPGFERNGWFYCYHATPELSTISRFSVDSLNRDSVVESSEKIIMSIPSSGIANHKGGQISFGPDGYLYIALGDASYNGDENKVAQNPASLLGKILRIDVHDTTGGRPYGIPPENPYAGATNGRRGEIFAYGFRNPWRFSFDLPTGRLWVGDVGHEWSEEIDLVVAGANYGWSIIEGRTCFRATECDSTGLTMPVWVHTHSGPDSTRGASITGGFVYRGTRFPDLVGKYIYGDIGGNIWALDYQPDGESTSYLVVSSDLSIIAFGRDSDGELYFTHYGNRGIPGGIYRLAPVVSGAPDGGSETSMTITSTRVAPVPADDALVIEYTLSQTTSVRLTIADATGRELAVVLDGLRGAGVHREPVITDRLPAGIYYFTVAAGEERRIGRFIVQ
jgi:glucose/arabinose dehydrogenase